MAERFQTEDDPPVLILIGTIGTDARIWTRLQDDLDGVCRVLPIDLPGHGNAPAMQGPGRMGALITRIESYVVDTGVADAVVLGHGLGGLVAQGLAVKRLDLVRGLILSATAARIGYSGHWSALADRLRRDGADALAEVACNSWLRRDADSAPLVNMIREQSTMGMAQVAEAAAGSDFFTTTSALRLPTLAIVGSLDRAVPPDLVRETASLVPGSQMRLITGAGHLAMLDQPESFCKTVRGFLDQIRHTASRPQS